MSFYFAKEVNLSFEDAIIKVTEEVKKEGFGILTEIDIKETLKKKLDADFRKYKILGACNPNFAFEALQKEEHIGLMLPCNLIVQQKGDTVEIAAINPLFAMSNIGNEELTGLAKEVAARLQRIIENL